MIQKLKTEDERYNIILDFGKHTDKNGIGALARIIYTIGQSYGRFGDDLSNEEEKLITLDQLQILEKLYVTRIQSIAATNSLLDLNDFNHIMFLWETFDKSGAQQYINNLFKDDFQKLRYICAMAGRWSGTNGSGWSFRSSNYTDYITEAEIFTLIQKYDKKNIEKFSDIEQVKLASFFLNYQKDEADHVNEQEAMKLVNQWRNS